VAFAGQTQCSATYRRGHRGRVAVEGAAKRFQELTGCRGQAQFVSARAPHGPVPQSHCRRHTRRGVRSAADALRTPHFLLLTHCFAFLHTHWFLKFCFSGEIAWILVMVERDEVPASVVERRSAGRDVWHAIRRDGEDGSATFEGARATARSSCSAGEGEGRARVRELGLLPVLGWIARRERLPAPFVDDVLVVGIRGDDG